MAKLGQRDAIVKALQARGEKMIGTSTHWMKFTREYAGRRDAADKLTRMSNHTYWFVNRANGAMRVGKKSSDTSLAVRPEVRDYLIEEGRNLT